MFIFKKFLNICLIFVFLLASVSAFADTVKASEDKVFYVLMDLPRFTAQDKDEPLDEREYRFSTLSAAIMLVVDKYDAHGISDIQLISALITIAYKETRLAKNVGIGRCDLMPAGQRCDNGLAKTYFQLHERACPYIWKEEIKPGSDKELVLATYCAAKHLTSAFFRCRGKNPHGDWAGAFSGYRSIDCNWEPKHEYQSPKARAQFMNKIMWQISNMQLESDEGDEKKKDSDSPEKT